MSDFNLQWRPQRLSLGDFQLRLDPDIAADIRRLQFESASARLRSLILNPDWSSLQQSDLELMLRQAPASPQPAVPRGRGPQTPRAGEVGDVLKAVWKIPAVNNAANRVLDDIARQLRRGWNQSSTGERVLLVSHTITLGGGALTAVFTNRQTRVGILDFLSGKDIPVPKVDGLTFQIRHNRTGPQPDYGLVISFDVAPYFRD